MNERHDSIADEDELLWKADHVCSSGPRLPEIALHFLIPLISIPECRLPERVVASANVRITKAFIIAQPLLRPFQLTMGRPGFREEPKNKESAAE